MRKVYFKRIEELEKILKYSELDHSNLFDNSNTLMELVIEDDYSMRINYDSSKAFYRVLEIASKRTLFGMEQLITILGNYIPIYDMNNNLLFSKEDYDLIKSKMQGLSHYGSNNYTFSSNLDFPGIDEYVSKIEESVIDSTKKSDSIIKLLKFELGKKGISVGVGNEKYADVILIDIGSTGRGTNIPYDADFDFMARISPRIYNKPSKLMELKNMMISILGGDVNSNLLHGQLRSVSCKTPGITEPLSVGVSFVSQEKVIEYTTELAIIDRLETIKKIDENKYKKVIANIILAKQFLKKYGAYKPSRSDKKQAGLGGVGVENLILQNGGSFYDAASEFLQYAENKDFIEFENSYPIFDFGKNHVSMEKNTFPYDNFIMKNMHQDGYEKICRCLKDYVECVDKEKININKEKK